MIKTALALLVVSLSVCTGCTHSEVELKPVEIKPIHITVDVNVRVEKAVDDFYGDIYGKQQQQKK